MYHNTILASPTFPVYNTLLLSTLVGLGSSLPVSPLFLRSFTAFRSGTFLSSHLVYATTAVHPLVLLLSLVNLSNSRSHSTNVLSRISGTPTPAFAFLSCFDKI